MITFRTIFIIMNKPAMLIITITIINLQQNFINAN